MQFGAYVGRYLTDTRLKRSSFVRVQNFQSFHVHLLNFAVCFAEMETSVFNAVIFSASLRNVENIFLAEYLAQNYFKSERNYFAS